MNFSGFEFNFFKESCSFRFSFRSMLGQFNNLTFIKFSMVEINLLVLHGFSILDPYQKYPFKGQLSLTGYAQSSVPGELTNITQALPGLEFSQKPAKSCKS